MNCEIPEVLCIILKNTGYDSLFALQSLELEQIVEIENFISSDKIFLYLLKDTIYSNTQPFKLLPGHKLFLNGLKKKD